MLATDLACKKLCTVLNMSRHLIGLLVGPKRDVFTANLIFFSTQESKSR